MLKLHNEVPDSVQAMVHHGHVTLTGTVDWHYQRVQAEKAVRHIHGVRHVIDRIAVVPRAAAHDMRKRIAQALYRNATLDAKHIDVTVTGSVAHLKGTATTWLQRDAAERAAYDSPGITIVDNQIVVDPPNDDTCEIC
jgi:osmotically-inducible protein OsmY